MFEYLQHIKSVNPVEDQNAAYFFDLRAKVLQNNGKL